MEESEVYVKFKSGEIRMYKHCNNVVLTSESLDFHLPCGWHTDAVSIPLGEIEKHRIVRRNVDTNEVIA